MYSELFLTIWQTLIFSIIAYFIGSILGAQISSLIYNVDIKNQGSKNQGATNATRVHGRKVGLTTFGFDLIKPIITFFILYGLAQVWVYGIIQIGVFFTIIGHIFPWTSGFKGGKGVASTFGLMLVLNWIVCLSMAVMWISFFYYKRISSLTSLITFWTVGMLVWIPTFWNDPDFTYLFISQLELTSSLIYTPIIITINMTLVTIKHSTNIKNLINGSEGKIKAA